MLNNSGESGHPCLVPNLRGNTFSFSLLRIMLAMALLYVDFSMLKYDAFLPTFWRVFLFFVFNHK